MATVLVIRSLSDGEVSTHYLPLRKAILHDELSWTKIKVEKSDDLLDFYDESSVHFGVFSGSTMVAGVRLIISEALSNLPSGGFISSRLDIDWAGTTFAEISRVMVTSEFRKRGLVAIIIRRALAEAKKRKIKNVVISVPRSPKVDATLANLGFELLMASFTYNDTCITPDVEAACYRVGSEANFHHSDYLNQIHLIEQAILEIH